MDPSSSSELSSQSKRHSFPAILTYSETLSVLSKHQREYNDKQVSRRTRTPTFNSKGSDEERWQRLQEAMKWLKRELTDMHHQDKFLLRQFNHLNRSILDLKEEQQLMEGTEVRQQKQDVKKEQVKPGQVKKEQVKNEKVKLGEVKKEPVKNEKVKSAEVKKEQVKNEKVKPGEVKKEQVNGEQLKLEQLKRERLKQDQLKQQQSLKEEKLNLEQHSLNEYDSDYGSDQSMDKFEDWQPAKNDVISNVSPKMTQKHSIIKRWTWWK